MELKKRIWKTCRLLTVLLFFLCAAGGCGAEEKNRTPMDFTVVDPDEIPAELAEVIEEHREEEMQLAFRDQADLYAVRGYGKQETGGYSIAVDECSEDEEQIYVATTLIGPPSEDKLSREPSYPVIVLKVENRDKKIIFE